MLYVDTHGLEVCAVSSLAQRGKSARRGGAEGAVASKMLSSQVKCHSVDVLNEGMA